MESRLSKQSEVLDVCCNNLIKCVTCDKPSTDGYEIGNLVANNMSEKRKGFLAERFIKPPVILIFEFKCEIYINYITIFCKVGAQKTTGIELFSQSHINSGQYESVGSGVLSDIQNGFVFHRYCENVRNAFGDQYCFRTFKSSSHLSRVKSCKIKIFRTNGTVPALGKIEIWGIPHKPLLPSSPNCIRPTVKYTASSTAKETTSSASNQLKSTINTNLNMKSFISNTSCISVNAFQNLSIPDDFIDPITCELMIQPVIMPSGKVVDNSTLESYQKAELHWGRGPSDPFTGLPFTDSNRPVAASDLKARIDKFLSDNCNNTELHKIPRTVGRNFFPQSSQQNIKSVGVSKLINKSSFSYKHSDDNSSVNCSENQDLIKRRKIEEDTNIISENRPKSSSLLMSANHNLDLSKCTKKSYSKSGIDSKLSIPLKHCSFQDRMEQSLELSLRTTLSKLPKLTTAKHDSAENTLIVCCVCKSCDNLFTIPCNHFICRKCLVNLMKNEPIKCLLCNFLFKSSEVQKVHVFK